MLLFQKKVIDWYDLTDKELFTDIDIQNEYRKYLEFLNITEATLQNVREAALYLEPYKETIVNKFYENVTKSMELNQIILDHTTVERLKITLLKYVEQFLKANIDDVYIENLIRIGKTHSRINLKANHFLMAHDMIFQYMTTILMEKLHKQPDKMMRLVVAVETIGSFDKQLIIELYMESTFLTFLNDISTLLNDMTELDTSQQLINGTDEQIAATENVTSATEEMSASIQEVSNHAEEVAKNADDTVEKVDQSREIIDTALRNIEEIEETYQSVLNEVQQLEVNIEHTNTVVKVINEIADQTNLLALNASIEAVRAGEYGRGFEVVAGEVRKLSEHTKKQIELITKNMETLQHYAKQLAHHIKSTGELIEESSDGSQAAQNELSNIITHIKDINSQTSEIAAMTEEQSAAISEINERNVTIFDISKEVQTVAKETAKIIYDISKKMDNYRLKFLQTNIVQNERDIIRIAKTDHLLWKWNIYNLILGIADLSVEDVGSHRSCRLGKWYQSKLNDKINHLEAFKKLDEPHRKVHELAKEAIEQYRNGNIDEANLTLRKLEGFSMEVVEYLEQLEKVF